MCVLKENDKVVPDGTRWDPFADTETPDAQLKKYSYEMKDGVFQITGCLEGPREGEKGEKGEYVYPYPCIEEFMEDQKVLLALSTHGPV